MCRAHPLHTWLHRTWTGLLRGLARCSPAQSPSQKPDNQRVPRCPPFDPSSRDFMINGRSILQPET